MVHVHVIIFSDINFVATIWKENKKLRPDKLIQLLFSIYNFLAV